MIKKVVYDIYYNDGVYYGTYVFRNKTRKQIKKVILGDILANNTSPNKDYHISFKNFKRNINFQKGAF